MGCVMSSIASVLAFTSTAVLGQSNSWINPASGNWDEASSWSLGALPNSSQWVMITNSGFKAVAIGSSTPVNFPGSMSVSNLTLCGPTNSFNTLLLNFVGAGNPLVIGDSNTPGSLVIGTNSAMVMFSSGLIVNNGLGTNNSHLGEFEVDGAFTQDDNAEVVAGFLNLTGTYNFTNSMLFVETQFVNGTFYQQGGVNTGTVEMQNTNGDYELLDGVVQGDEFLYAGTFHQSGGTNRVSSLLLTQGGYLKSGGDLFAGGISVIGSSGPLFAPLSPGMTQWNGTTTITNDLTVEGQGNRHAPEMATFNLYGGSLSANRILLEQNGFFRQTNGTVDVTNDLYITDNSTLASVYYLSDGTLSTSNTTITSSYPENSSFSESGGTHHISNTLSILGMGRYSITDGAVIVPHIVLSGNISNPAQFWVNGLRPFAVVNSGTVSMNGGAIVMEDSQQDFGSLNIGGDSGINFAGNLAILRFTDSHTNSWAASSQFLMYNWKGSASGGGVDQLIFGTSSSGLTASQLAQIIFVNPAGFPSGNYSARILSTGEVVPDQGSSSPGLVNSWISGDGNWDDAAAWSLGILPDISQSIMITNSGWKAVAINPSTPINFPSSLTVSNLTIRGATNTENTLLLNFFGTGVPLTVLSGLTLQDGAQILNFNSGLVVQGGTILVTNSQIIQDGGFMRMTNAQLDLYNSEYDLTNGVLEAGAVWIGLGGESHINQYGGTATIASLVFPFYTGSTTGTRGYALYGGMLNLPGGMSLGGDGGSPISYLQQGGTNQTTDITLEPGLSGPRPDFKFNGGLLVDNNVNVFGDTISTEIRQNGGTHSVSNVLTIMGGTRTGTIHTGLYQLNGGTLSAGSIVLNSSEGSAQFVQTNGVAHAEEIEANGYAWWGSYSELTLAGGSLSCSNSSWMDGTIMHQNGGALVVTHSLSFGGYRVNGGDFTNYSRYELFGGMLTASNISIGGDLIIGDSATNRVNNPGTCALSHTLQIGNATAQLGRFILASNATIDLAGISSKLSFADSSSEAWTGSGTLVVTNWNGNSSGGGAEQLKFGTSQSGLTSAQLNQIQFQVGTNSYSAKILNTGEVVPDHAIVPVVAFSTQGNNMVLNWPAGWSLQASTNASGPYFDVPNVTSPYTNDMTLDRQRYFRLRQ
jgi:hypothetical protein